MPGPIFATRVASFSPRGAKHAIRGEFSYTHPENNRTVCGRRGLMGTEELMSGRPVEVTCRACIRILS